MRNFTEANIRLYEQAMQLHMFLVGELGPTKLLFKVGEGDDALKVKISLTDKLECSCNPGSKTRCIHGVFAMVKVFKVPCDDPLVFQEKFTDAQLNMILEGRFKKKTLERKKHNFLKRRTQEKATPQEETRIKPKLRKEIDASETCPICYEELGDTDPLAPCKCCSNGFHIKCLLTWSKHQMKVEPHKPIKCPMCRAVFDNSPGETIRHLEYEVQKFLKKEFVHPGSNCAGCNKKELIGPVFASIWQDNKLLCKPCFDSKHASKRNLFITKMKTKDSWQPADERFPKISHFLACSLPSLGQSDTDQLQIVGFDAASINCQRCSQKTTSTAAIKKLPCEHKICLQCLMQHWKPAEELFTCPADGLPVFPMFKKSIHQKFVADSSGGKRTPIRSLTLVQNPKQVYKGTEDMNDKQKILTDIANEVKAKLNRRKGSAGKRLMPMPSLAIENAIAVTPLGITTEVNASEGFRKVQRRPIGKSSRLLPPKPHNPTPSLTFEPMLTVTRAAEQTSLKSQLPSILDGRSRHT